MILDVQSHVSQNVLAISSTMHANCQSQFKNILVAPLSWETHNCQQQGFLYCFLNTIFHNLDNLTMRQTSHFWEYLNCLLRFQVTEPPGNYFICLSLHVPLLKLSNTASIYYFQNQCNLCIDSHMRKQILNHLELLKT